MRTSDIAFAKALRRLTVLVFLAASSLATTACSFGGSGGGSGTTSAPMAAYCSPARTFSSSVNVSGKAYYQYRYMGNGDVSDSQWSLDVAGTAIGGHNYQLAINGQSHAWNCSNTCSATEAITGLIGVINGASSSATATNSGGKLIVKPKVGSDSLTVDGFSSKVSATTVASPRVNPHPNPNPIRYAEIRVTDGGGNIVQCGETGADGSFSFPVPANSGNLTVNVLSRSSNSQNTAYIMNNPTANEPYKVSTTVGSGSSTTNLLIVAPATGTLEGGAFNILDQIYKAQAYLRTETANCSSAGGTFHNGCTPFTTAPTVYVYWTKGVSPGVYVGQAGGISFYLNTKRELYILGGLNGDFENEDMDHFDNSVIVHEYAHFLEDQFGKPNSPGGSHDGNSIIDPRLAWGEGWANFFQAAALDNQFYRDTYGHVDCTGTPKPNQTFCYGTAFNVDLTIKTSGGGGRDIPQTTGEGNFREFSISRILWSAIKGSFKFSEIWSVFHSSSGSMKNTADPFKSISRFHSIQKNLAGSDTWSTIRTDEKQIAEFTDYARPFNSSCGSTNQTMTIIRSSTDDGDFATANHLQNNDFYVYNHPGGTLNLNLTWSHGSNRADLDLYIYQEGYSFGRSGLAGKSDATTIATSGSESISGNLPAGTYMINVYAYTGLVYPTGTRYYSAGSSYPTTYNLTLNGQPVCPL